MRTKYSFYNFIVNLLTSVILPILGFIKLRLFLDLYGSSVNGFQVTIAQIITFLNVCEIAYSLAFRQLLFKPLAQNDTRRVNEIYYGAKKVFNITGILVISLGVFISLIFPFLAKSPFNYEQTVFTFLILCLPYGISYFLMGPNFVIIADQKEYKINIVIQLIAIIRMLLMIGIILLKQSFFYTLIIEGLNILLANILARRIALKNYPWLKNKAEKKDSKVFITNAKYTIIQRLSSLATNNTDNIVISSFLGYAMSGIYAVYSYLNDFVFKIVNTVINSTINSFGNLFNDKNADSYKVFTEFFSFASYTASVVSVCIFVIMDQFVHIILNKNDIGNIPIYIILMFAINIFYLTIREPIIISRDANGLFRDAKNNAYLLAVSKLLLSITLVKIFNIAGVILATLITNWVVDFLYNPKLVYERVFNLGVYRYYRMVFTRLVMTLLVGCIAYFIWQANLVFIARGSIYFLISCIILGSLVAGSFALIYYISFKSFRNLVKRIISLVNIRLKKGNIA